MRQAAYIVAETIHAAQTGQVGLNSLMELKPGYKQTEVGVIPEGWDVALVSSLLALPIQNGVFNEPSRKGRGCKLINVIDLYGSFPIDTKDLERFDANRDEFLRFGVKHGDMFFTRSSLTLDGIAKCNVYRGDGNEDVVFDCHIIRVRPNSRKAEPFYLARYCNSRPARSYLVANAKTTTMTTIDQSVVAKLPVALPPLPEQRAIATALSDVDGLLGGLDRLFAKKRDLKQAAMQQLLTGQTRLPGFQGEWEVKRLGEVGSTYGGLTGKAKADFGEGPARYITFMNVMSNVVIDYGTFEQVQVSPTESQNRAKKGDLFFNGSSETPEEVAMCSVLLDEVRDVYLNSFCFGFRFHDGAEANGLFLAYYLRSKEGRELMKSLAQGSTRYNLSKVALLKSPLRLPKLPEQTAIAAVLTELDAELAALEQRREKTRALKQALMQELLTGRTRLL